MTLQRLALAIFASTFLAGQAAADHYIDIEVCNESYDEATVAMSYQPVDIEEGYWVNVGWFSVAPGTCEVIGQTENRYFYLYADAGNSGYWGGNFDLCVEYPGPFEYITYAEDGYSCNRSQELVGFRELQAEDGPGTYTWKLAP